MTTRKLIRIKFVKRSLLAGAVAALLAAPMAVMLSSSEPEAAPGAPAPVLAGDQDRRERAEPKADVALLPPGSKHEAESPAATPQAEKLTGPAAARAEVAQLRRASREDLLETAKSGTDLQRLAAVNVLWARGERETVEQLVAEAQDDRVLAAKLEALRRAR